jgi:S-adenosylmethionine hydrolase
MTIVLFTDFGADDIYVGQVKAALTQHLPPDSVVVDLLHNAPTYRARAGAHLLDALRHRFPADTVFLAVVDPGVGTARDAVVLQADDQWYVGPDNGLLSVVYARAAKRRAWRIAWRPQELSASFHGRDLFAPVAARLAENDLPSDWIEDLEALEVRLGPADLPEIIYVDHYGNALTGLRATTIERTAALAVKGHRLSYARVFAEASGGPFWYENSIGLVELAADRRSAAALLGIDVGDAVEIVA